MYVFLTFKKVEIIEKADARARVVLVVKQWFTSRAVGEVYIIRET